MADPRFYAARGPFTLGELARISGARIDGEAPKDAVFTDVAPLESAKREHVSFLDNRKYADDFAENRLFCGRSGGSCNSTLNELSRTISDPLLSGLTRRLEGR